MRHGRRVAFVASIAASFQSVEAIKVIVGDVDHLERGSSTSTHGQRVHRRLTQRAPRDDRPCCGRTPLRVPRRAGEGAATALAAGHAIQTRSPPAPARINLTPRVAPAVASVTEFVPWLDASKGRGTLDDRCRRHSCRAPAPARTRDHRSSPDGRDRQGATTAPEAAFSAIARRGKAGALSGFHACGAWSYQRRAHLRHDRADAAGSANDAISKAADSLVIAGQGSCGA